MNVYTYRVAYVEMYSAFERFIKCIFFAGLNVDCSF